MGAAREELPRRPLVLSLGTGLLCARRVWPRAGVRLREMCGPPRMRVPGPRDPGGTRQGAVTSTPAEQNRVARP